MVQYNTMTGYRPFGGGGGWRLDQLVPPHAPPDPFIDDGWDSADPDVHIECLMPNGIVVPLDVPKEETLENIKQKLWESKFPLHGMLRDMSQYVFQCVTPQAEAIELLNESWPLLSVRPVFRVLRVIKREGNKEEKLFMSQIGNLIGKNLHDFETHNNAEVNEFRGRMRRLGEFVASERETFTWEKWVQYSYPCAVCRAEQPPKVLLSHLQADGLMTVMVMPQSESQSLCACTTLRVPPLTTTAQELVRLVLAKVTRRRQPKSAAAPSPQDFSLRVLGRQMYLMGDPELWRFAPVQEALAAGVPLRLLLVANSSICVPERESEPGAAGQDAGGGVPRASSSTLRRGRPRPVISWAINQEFSITVQSLAYLPVDDGVREIGLEAALFCGGKKLCDSQRESQLMLTEQPEQEVLQLERRLQFAVQVCDLPRTTRLSLAVYELARQPRGIKSVKQAVGGKYCNYLAWVNAPVYDYRGELRSGDVTLYMWPYVKSMSVCDEPLQPLATAVANPDSDEAPQISISFHSYCATEERVLYPSVEWMRQNAELVATNGHDEPTDDGVRPIASFFGRENTEQLKMKLAGALEQDMRALDLTDRDKKVLWSLRHQCQSGHPNALPKLLQCVDWSKHVEVAEMTMLLENWQLLAPDKSLALLDVNIADTAVRQFAVRCLEKSSDEELEMYLLQLVQALKHENYLFSELAEFLLTRAIRSLAIGSRLFWHLRSEMHVPSVRVRNALLLEAYCRASPHHMHSLCRLHDTLKTLTDLSEKVQAKRSAGMDKEKIKEAIKEEITAAANKNVLTNFCNPLDQSVKCSHLRLSEFTYFESKKAPLRLVFENVDERGDTVNLIFKSGDDLRQDMLTLQTIRVIDKLWKDQGLDLRLTPYGCMSTGHRAGVIELVQNARTVANIHRGKGGIFKPTAAFGRHSIFNWLRGRNRTDEELARAVRQFSLSCAGYSVITFVLGIADRHSDNVMVKENGQLLHIDFGHILGHFKEKFGIRRERVPFVLTSDFVHVIMAGDKNNHAMFEEFRRKCEQAYLILRRHGDFIISLFGMMISTGLPDVSSENDLHFLYSTLRLDVSEEEALRFFREKFDEALSKSSSATFNNIIHSIVTNNSV